MVHKIGIETRRQPPTGTKVHSECVEPTRHFACNLHLHCEHACIQPLRMGYQSSPRTHDTRTRGVRKHQDVVRERCQRLLVSNHCKHSDQQDPVEECHFVRIGDEMGSVGSHRSIFIRRFSVENWLRPMFGAPVHYSSSSSSSSYSGSDSVWLGIRRSFIYDRTFPATAPIRASLLARATPTSHNASICAFVN